MNVRLCPQFITKTCCIIYRYSAKLLISPIHSCMPAFLWSRQMKYSKFVDARTGKRSVFGFQSQISNVLFQNDLRISAPALVPMSSSFHAVDRYFSNDYSGDVDDRKLRILACHCEDSHHAVDAPVSQQGHVHRSGGTFLLFPFGFKRCPDTSPEDQQVEDDHHYHSWDVDPHDEIDAPAFLTSCYPTDNLITVRFQKNWKIFLLHQR